MINEQVAISAIDARDPYEQRLDALEKRIDELEKRQYEFMVMLRDVVEVLKRQSETLDTVVKP